MPVFNDWATPVRGAISARTFDARALDRLNVNEFYPANAGVVHDGNSHPLSNYYPTIFAAQADYPFADSLDNEVDWCAWQAALLYIYEHQWANRIGQQNGGSLYADGNYRINKTITCNVAAINIIGNSAFMATGFSTSIVYLGPAGTVDAPVYIFDFWTISEAATLATQPGSSTRSTVHSGPRVDISNIIFLGNGKNIQTNSVSISDFISGIRIRFHSWLHIHRCTFSDTLWDGIVSTGAALFDVIEYNVFTGVHRDAISYPQIASNFSTTLWIRYNEFGTVGRYSILLDLFGSVEAAPRIIGNSFEPAFDTSYFVLNPEWFVHGVVSAMCFINCGNINYRDNRTEGIIITAGYLAEAHFVACTNVSIRDEDVHHVAFTCNTGSVTAPRTTALINYVNANKYGDITNERNYNAGTATDFGQTNDSPILSNIYNLTKIVTNEARGLTAADTITMEHVEFTIDSYPVIDGTFAKKLNLAGVITAIDVNSYALSGDNIEVPETTSINSVAGNVVQAQFNYGRWGNALSAKKSAIDNIAELLFLNEVYLRTGNNGSVDGSNAVSWDGYRGLTLNRSVSDLTAATANFLDFPVFFANTKDSTGTPLQYTEIAGSVMTTRKIRYNFAAAPVSGTWNTGDIVYDNNPAPGGFIGWVCTSGGTPGTWKTFGAITP